MKFNLFRVTNVIVKSAGATQNSFILRNSKNSEDLSRQQTGYLLGERGYPLQTRLMTPYLLVHTWNPSGGGII